MKTWTNLDLARLGGQAPFELRTCLSWASKSLMEHNNEAAQHVNYQVWQAAKNLGVQPGTCQLCGMTLMHSYVIQDGNGDHFVLGCDCIAKLGDNELLTAVEFEKKRIARNEQIRKEKHEAMLRREVYEADQEAQRQQERKENYGYTLDEFAEIVEADDRAEALAIVAADVATDRHLGEPGERREFEGVIVGTFSYESEWGTGYCTKVAVDGGGCVLYWNHLGQEGQRIHFKATIKEHDLDRRWLENIRLSQSPTVYRYGYSLQNTCLPHRKITRVQRAAHVKHSAKCSICGATVKVQMHDIAENGTVPGCPKCP